MNFPLFTARRIGLQSRSGNNNGSGIAVAGIALSFAIMLLSIAIVTGFKHEIQRKLTGFNSQISITPYVPEDRVSHGISLSDTIADIISREAGNVTTSVAVRKPAVLKTDSDFMGVMLKGISPESQTAHFLARHLASDSAVVTDSIFTNTNSIVISREVADRLKLAKGDRVRTHFIEESGLRTRTLTVTEIFDTHFSEFDRAIAFTPLPFLQSLCHLDSLTGSVIEINGLDDEMIDPVAQAIYTSLIENAVKAEMQHGQAPELYEISTIHTTCAMYFSWLELLDTNVYVILILMAAISLFTLISSLFIVILDKIRLIGTLKALGATDSQIRRIFILLTEKLLIKGLIIGNIISLAIIAGQKYFRILPLDPSAYYLDYVPVEISWPTIILLNISAIIISAIALILPSHIIAGISPAKSIRFE